MFIKGSKYFLPLNKMAIMMRMSFQMVVQFAAKARHNLTRNIFLVPIL